MSKAKHPHKPSAEAERKKKLDEALDHGLEETFPGSDSVNLTQPPHSVEDKSDRRRTGSAGKSKGEPADDEDAAGEHMAKAALTPNTGGV